MSKMLLVARREYFEFLRTKAFWIGIASVPILIVLASVLGRWMSKAKDVRHYTVLDRSPGEWFSKEVHERGVFDALTDDHPLKVISPEHRMALMTGNLDALDPKERAAIARYERKAQSNPQEVMAEINAALAQTKFKRKQFEDLGADPEASLAQKLRKGEVFAYFVIPEDPVGQPAGGLYVSENPADEALKKWFENVATTIVRERRVAAMNLTEEQARSVREQMRFNDKIVSRSTGKVEEVTAQVRGSRWAPVAFVYLLWIAVITAAQMLLTNTIEEKSNRIIEVLLSSVSPFQLMAGKVLGIAATGLTLISSWVICALLGASFMPGLEQLKLTDIVANPVFLASFVGYFVAGYLLYAAILVGIGSVCNSLKEAQNLMQPVFILLIVPLVAMVPITQDPNGTIAKVLTYIPFFTPFVMMNRAAGPPPVHEYVITSLMLVVCITIAFWGAAKIFRIGILMTGKPPRVREIFRWLRAPTGILPQRRE